MKRLFLLCILIALLLALITSRVHASEDIEVPVGPAPISDGIISAGEWDNAVEIKCAHPWQAVYFMHDDVNLYLAAQMQGYIDEFYIAFDTSGNGELFDAGDDLKRCFETCSDCGYTVKYQPDRDEHQNVIGIRTYDENENISTFEVEIPKISTDREGNDPDIGADKYILVALGIVHEGEEYTIPVRIKTSSVLSASPTSTDFIVMPITTLTPTMRPSPTATITPTVAPISVPSWVIFLLCGIVIAILLILLLLPRVVKTKAGEPPNILIPALRTKKLLVSQLGKIEKKLKPEWNPSGKLKEALKKTLKTGNLKKELRKVAGDVGNAYQGLVNYGTQWSRIKKGRQKAEDLIKQASILNTRKEQKRVIKQRASILIKVRRGEKKGHSIILDVLHQEQKALEKLKCIVKALEQKDEAKDIVVALKKAVESLRNADAEIIAHEIDMTSEAFDRVKKQRDVCKKWLTKNLGQAEDTAKPKLSGRTGAWKKIEKDLINNGLTAWGLHRKLKKAEYCQELGLLERLINLLKKDKETLKKIHTVEGLTDKILKTYPTAFKAYSPPAKRN